MKEPEGGIVYVSLVEFCVTKATDGWEEACEFDREVNCVHVYRLCTENCS